MNRAKHLPDTISGERSIASVAVVGGDTLFRALLKLLLSKTDFNVDYEIAGFDCGMVVREEAASIDLAVVLLRTDESNAVDKLRAVGKSWPSVPLVAMGEGTDLSALRICLTNRCSAYLPLDISIDVLVHSLHVVMLGGTVFPVEVRGLLGPNAGDAQSTEMNGQSGQFTPRERQVLGFLAKGMANKEIGREMDIGDATVKVYVRNLMRKSGTRNRTHLAIWANERPRSRPMVAPGTPTPSLCNQTARHDQRCRMIAVSPGAERRAGK